MATLASTSRVQVRYAEEAVFGEINEVGDHKELRATGESLNFTLSKEGSEEINAFRGVSSMIAVSAEASGGVNAELSFGEYDPLLAATLQDTWKPFGVAGLSVPMELAIDATTIVAGEATTGASAFTLLKPGQWFTVYNAVENKNRLFRVAKDTLPTATVITLDPGTPGEAEALAAGVISASRLSNGIIQRSFTLERESGDTSEFFAYRGMTASSMNLSVASGARTTLEFSFMGRDAVADDATMLPGEALPSKTYPIMSAVAGTSCALWAKGAPLVGTSVNSIGMSYDNALRMQNAICSLGAVGIGSGSIALTLDLEVYFASGRVFYDEFLANENMEIAFTAFDTLGNGYIFTLPNANISTYTLNASGKDQDLVATISVTGLLAMESSDPALRGKVLHIDRVGAALAL